MKNKFISIFALILVSHAVALNASETKTKYGPHAVPLSLDHRYFKSADAPDFWALMPYYLPQQNDRSCSVATAAMLMNAVRVDNKLTASDELVTESNLLKKVNSELWDKAIGSFGQGVNLEQLASLIEQSLQAYGFKKFKVSAVHLGDTSPRSMQKLRVALVANEKSKKDFIILNFVQSAYTDDTPVGHFAPLGAYDSKTKRALVMDPDRKWYEPYWVSEETLLKGLATQDKEAGQSRGFIWVQIL